MIRDMKYSDLDRVLDILGESIEEGTSTFRRVVPEKEAWHKGHTENLRYVKEIDGKVAGWIALTSKTESSPAYFGVCEISIYIDSKYRGRGIGYELLSKIVNESEKEGIWTLESAIFADNITSIKLHEKLGFNVVGIRRAIGKDKFDKWRDVVLMERRSNIY